jgi:hypothetical protein
MQKINMILKVEHDFKQCIHIFLKTGPNNSQNHFGQNDFVKVYTP